MSIQKTILRNDQLFVINASTGEVLRRLKPITVTCRSDIWYYINQLTNYKIQASKTKVPIIKDGDTYYAVFGSTKELLLRPVWDINKQKEVLKKTFD